MLETRTTKGVCSVFILVQAATDSPCSYVEGLETRVMKMEKLLTKVHSTYAL
jgi:hypothetical protein